MQISGAGGLEAKPHLGRFTLLRLSEHLDEALTALIYTDQGCSTVARDGTSDDGGGACGPNDVSDGYDVGATRVEISEHNCGGVSESSAATGRL